MPRFPSKRTSHGFVRRERERLAFTAKGQYQLIDQMKGTLRHQLFSYSAQSERETERERESENIEFRTRTPRRWVEAERREQSNGEKSLSPTNHAAASSVFKTKQFNLSLPGWRRRMCLSVNDEQMSALLVRLSHEGSCLRLSLSLSIDFDPSCRR